MEVGVASSSIGEFYFSAPTTPSYFHSHFDHFSAPTNHSVGYDVVFGSKTNNDDFAFDLSQNRETQTSLSAEELFDGGVIKPMKPPPPQQHPAPATVVRGRGLHQPSRRAARSLSPIRDTQFTWEEETEQPPHNGNTPIACSVLSASVKGHKKWRLKDLFLFRSASEGRAAEKYTAAAMRRSSFGGPGSRRSGPVSAHELHYTVNRAVSEDLKKKTFLPYKQGIIGLLAFNPAVHALATGFGLSRK